MKLFIQNFLIFIIIFCTSCIKTKSLEDDNNMKVENEVSQEKLLGTWYLNEWDLYHTLSFSENNIVSIDNHIDTIFTYYYEVEGDSLLFLDKFNNKKYYVNQIEYVNDNELVFLNFMDKGGRQYYNRKKQK